MANGTATVNASGGLAGYSYNWTPIRRKCAQLLRIIFSPVHIR
ncbi:MAG: SprB repeat-containing protein [Bacteroidetes bacterium]|nr:SprB repeat-containing protein [Bacteroidota bacterium]